MNRYAALLLSILLPVAILAGCKGPSEPETTEPYSNLDDNRTTSVVTNLIQIETGGTMASGGWVKVFLSVTDQDGRPLGEFNQYNFSVAESTEAGKTEIGSGNLYAETVGGTGQSATTCLMMDYSGYVADTVRDGMEGAAKLFINLMSGVDATEIIKFSGFFDVVQEFTSDKSALEAAVDTSWPGQGDGAALYDALEAGLTDTYYYEFGFKGLLVFATGLDDSSMIDTTYLYAIADEKGIPCYTVCLQDSHSLFLEELAERTGGRYFHHSMFEDPMDAYEILSRIQKKVYVLKWDVRASAGEYVTAIIKSEYTCGNGTLTSTATGMFDAP